VVSDNNSVYASTVPRKKRSAETLEDIFRTRFREERLARELSQADVAAACGMQQQTIAKIENGQRPIRVNELPLLAQSIGVRWEWLLEDPALREALEELVSESERRALEAQRAVARSLLDEADENLANAQRELLAAEERRDSALRQLRRAETDTTIFPLEGIDLIGSYEARDTKGS
jgi:transcriptional regulator with XRE-family HTH domain